MIEADQYWVAKSLFSHQGKLVEELKLWWHPPSISTTSSSPPQPGPYFHRRLFLWMPKRMFRSNFKCLQCTKDLTSKGLYNRVRLVIDLSSIYYLATEYLECRCGKTYLSWSDSVLTQLDLGHRMQFPAVLTYKAALDARVVTLLRSRTLGNSPSLLQHYLQELHSEQYLKAVLLYLTDCQHHKQVSSQGIMRYSSHEDYSLPPPFPGVRCYKWILACHSQDILARLEELEAHITSVYGTVLKIDSTKKITKKLAEEAKGTAAWATNIGNERGEVLMSVLTAAEGDGLKPLAQGLVKRYRDAQELPPVLLYVDRDCYMRNEQPTKYHELFHPWEFLVRLDI